MKSIFYFFVEVYLAFYHFDLLQDRYIIHLFVFKVPTNDTTDYIKYYLSLLFINKEIATITYSHFVFII